MADVEENMEEVAVEQEDQAKAEDTSKEEAAQSTTVGGVTMDEGMCAHMIYCLFVHGRGVSYSVSSLQNLITRYVSFFLLILYFC